MIAAIPRQGLLNFASGHVDDLGTEEIASGFNDS